MSINLIPFKSSAEVNGSFQLKEIIKSIIIFMPFGIYICMIKNKWNILKKVAPIFFTSLALEAAQFIFPIGAADITDLIGNTIGGILGIGVYVIFTKLYKELVILVKEKTAMAVSSQKGNPFGFYYCIKLEI